MDNCIDYSGARMICEALKCNCSLTDLDLDCNERNNWSSLTEKNTIEWIGNDICRNVQSEPRIIGEVLKRNTTLAKLNLGVEKWKRGGGGGGGEIMRINIEEKNRELYWRIGSKSHKWSIE